MAALMDADSGRGIDKLVAAIDRFRSFMDGSPFVDLVEDNPFGVAVPIRAQLGSALDIIALGSLVTPQHKWAPAARLRVRRHQ